ncbi:hypothetical protein OTK51_10525 [Vibrio scophthalmi]|uniref:hypothetical protein n=1 Tax=Vibrio scophthalmi TaxID=45658 RepID=UPI002283BEA7|nr:hypothetical protein [Vibrio scophthalmi]MCY9803866.1 hypothetical protein [Vibrio scophthalmi]
MKDTDIEFEHLWLEIQFERWPMVERFLLSYFCFSRGYITKAGKPDWQQARDCSCRSNNVFTLKHAELEPLVPLETIIGELKRYQRDGELTPQSAKRILSCLLNYAVITKQEKQQLKQLGLSQAMPASWYQSERKDPYERFALAGIHLTKISPPRLTI